MNRISSARCCLLLQLLLSLHFFQSRTLARWKTTLTVGARSDKSRHRSVGRSRCRRAKATAAHDPRRAFGHAAARDSSNFRDPGRRINSAAAGYLFASGIALKLVLLLGTGRLCDCDFGRELAGSIVPRSAPPIVTCSPSTHDSSTGRTPHASQQRHSGKVLFSP